MNLEKNETKIFRFIFFLFLITSIIISSLVFLKANSNKSFAAEVNTRCTNQEVAWGEWCVYYGLDANGNRNTAPFVVMKDFVNVYHASPWYRDGELNMLIGGWKNAGQNFDRVFRLKTQDPNGISGWSLVRGEGDTDEYIGNYFENPATTDLPSDVTNDVRGNPIRVTINGQEVYKAVHTVQPDVLASYEHPGNVNCCDTFYYAYDYKGSFPETHVGVHYAFLDQNGNLNKASQSTGKNPLIDWHAYNNLGGTQVSGVSDARVTFDPNTNKFYMVFTEWHYANTAVSSLAVSDSWSNSKFKVLTRTLVPSGLNPKLIVGKDRKYYLFYTDFTQLRVSSSNNVSGGYANERIILKPPQETGITVPGTPNIFCNRSTNQWQMYFSAGRTITQNQIYTAFLRQSCDLPPIYMANLSTPISTPTSTPSPTPVCPRKREGDADCNGMIQLSDFEEWRKEFNKEANTLKADFVGPNNAAPDGKVDLNDFEKWRRTYNSSP